MMMPHSPISTFRQPVHITLHPEQRSCNSGSTILRLNPFPKHSTFLIPSTGFPDLKIMAKKKAIDGVSDQMNAITFQNLNHAPARRRVRLAFTQVQQQLDHVLFKMAPSGIRTEERSEPFRLGHGSESFRRERRGAGAGALLTAPPLDRTAPPLDGHWFDGLDCRSTDA
ncbi:hypothetical protein R6Q57_021990 [Mikania cordata]